MPIGEILSGAGSLLGSLGNAIFGQSQSKALMRYQAELNQKAVDAQNVYNSPIEQVKRLREAGLNENLAFGNGVTGNQSDAKSVGIANRNPNLDVGLMNAVETYFKRKQLENETRANDQNIKESLSRTALNEEKTLSQQLDNAWKDATAAERVEQTRANLNHTNQSIAESNQRVEESIQRISNLKSTANLLQEQIRYWDAHATNERDYMPQLLKNRAYQALASGNLSEAQIGVAHSVVRLNNQKIEQLVHLIDKMDIEAGSEAIEFEIARQMKEFGAAGVKPKDLLDFLLKLLQTALK